MKKLLIFGGVVFFLILIAGIFAFQYRSKQLADRERIRLELEEKNKDVSVTFVEGLNGKEMSELVEKQFPGQGAIYLKLVTEPHNLQSSALSKWKLLPTLEGVLFPDTYRFRPSSTAEQVLSKQLSTFDTNLSKAITGVETNGADFFPAGVGLWYPKGLIGNAKKGFSLSEIVTLASIVEKESGNRNQSEAERQAERQNVAGVFYNRLQSGMKLESDATVNFVTKSGRAASTLDDLKVDSPYNTYQHEGLPPGPVSNPSYSSLYAVLHPTKSKYFFFLHSLKDGKAYFARDFSEHLENKRKYLR